MGLFGDKLKRFLKKPVIIADQMPQYERNERADYSEMINWVKAPQNKWVKFEGKPIRSNPQLHIKKTKSQKHNWKHWRRKR